MGLTSLQVCMDTSEWLQGTIHEDGGMDSSPSSGEGGGGGGDMITCSRPLLERRLRPQHDQALKCPRCDSAHTKFCYYNNYSLSQPRYFCKTCRRYWTKGGSLRNIPVGGGCRKNKRVSSKKSSSSSSNDHHPANPNNCSSNANNNDTTTTDLHLSFPHEAVQMPHFTSLFGNSAGDFGGLNLMESKYNAILDQSPSRHDHQVSDFMENSSSKYDHNLITGNPTSHDFMGNNSTHDLGLVRGLGLGDHHHQSGFTTTATPSNFHGFCTNSSLFGNISLNGNNNQHDSLMMNTQRLMLPFEALDHQEAPNHAFEMKPNKQQLLSQLDHHHHHHQWNHQQQQGGHHDQGGCNEVGKDSFGYFTTNSLGSWSGMMNGYGSSHQTNPLV